LAKKGIITSVTVPIDYSVVGQYELRRLTQIVKRDTHIINKYLGIIQYHQKYLLDHKKSQYSAKLDELTLSTRHGRKPQHDLKSKFPRISHNELLECRDVALGLFKSYLELSGDKGNVNTSFPKIANLTGRQINSRRWKLDSKNRTITIMDSMDSNPKMIRIGKNVTRHDWINIPLKLSKFHLEQINLGKLRTIQIVANKNQIGENQFGIKFSILHEVEQLPRKKKIKSKPVGVIGVDLGISIDITTALITGKGVVEYKTFKVDDDIKNSILKTENILKQLQRSSEIRKFDNFVDTFVDRANKLIDKFHSNTFNLHLDKVSLQQLYVIRDKLGQIRNAFKFSNLQSFDIKSKIDIVHNNRIPLLAYLEGKFEVIKTIFDTNYDYISKDDTSELRKLRKSIYKLIDSLKTMGLLFSPQKLYNTDSIYKKLREMSDKRKKLSIDADRKLAVQFNKYAEEISKDYDIYISIGKLKGIRNRSRRGNGNKYLRKLVNRWTFFRITNMIELKMAKLGLRKRLLVISEAWTSKTCWKCNTRGNRIHQNLFQCTNPNCGWKYNADVNGAINIAKRLIASLKLTSFSNKGVRGLGKYLPVTSSKKYSKKKNGKARRVPKNHNGSPNRLFGQIINRNAGTQSTHSTSLNEFFENDQPVVKNHGKTDSVETSKKRSRKTHRSNGTEPISTQPFLEIKNNKKDKVMATSDIG
jgi:IS605 OrfB family transposase